MDCSPPGFSVHGVFPGKNTGVGCHFLLQGFPLIPNGKMLADVFWDCQLNQTFVCQTWKGELVRKLAPLISLPDPAPRALRMCRRAHSIRKHFMKYVSQQPSCSVFQRASFLTFLRGSLDCILTLTLFSSQIEFSAANLISSLAILWLEKNLININGKI